MPGGSSWMAYDPQGVKGLDDDDDDNDDDDDDDEDEVAILKHKHLLNIWLIMHV
jgi:hypothetical protein